MNQIAQRAVEARDVVREPIDVAHLADVGLEIANVVGIRPFANRAHGASALGGVAAHQHHAAPGASKT